MAEAAERYGWYAVIPFGTPPRPTDTCCPDDCDEECCQNGRALDPSNACSWNSGSGGCCGAAVEANVDDVQFARDLVEWLSQNTCADTGENVFSTGFSNGAMFSNRLGCEAADLFKVRKLIFLRHSILKMIILPRQARDKHKESSKRDAFLNRESHLSKATFRQPSSAMTLPAAPRARAWPGCPFAAHSTARVHRTLMHLQSTGPLSTRAKARRSRHSPAPRPPAMRGVAAGTLETTRTNDVRILIEMGDTTD